MKQFLQGKKTYLVALAVGAVSAAYSLNYIDETTYKMLLGFLNAAGLTTMAAKMNRVDEKVDR